MDMMGSVKITIPEDVDLTGKEYLAVTNEEERADLLKMISEADLVAFDIETWSDNLWSPDEGAFHPQTGFIAGFSFSTRPYHARYLPITHVDDEFNAPEEFVNELLDVLATKDVVAHNAKFDSKWVRYHYGVELPKLHDTMVMDHLIDPNQHSRALKVLAKTHLNETMIPYDDSFPFNQYEVHGAALYAGGDADVVLRLYEKWKPQMARFKFLYTVEMALLHMVADLELNGVPVDKSYFGKQEEVVSKEIVKVSQELWEELQIEDHFGPWSANYSKILNSPAKLGILLFDGGLGLPVVERTKTGRASVSASALQQLEKDYPVVKKISLYKELVKLKSSFLVNLPGWINPVTGRIHGSYLQSHVPTGRFASKDPNMQQIPTHDVAEIRKAFVAPEGYRFVAFDYSQIEMRVFASEADETNLRRAFETGTDLHSATTSVMINVPVDQVTDDLRQIGKTLNFGLIYGMGPHGLAFRIGVTEDKAKDLIEAYFRAMPKARIWMDEVVRKARRDGGIFTHFGRWRPLPELKSNNPRERAKGERGAVNSIVQGTAADIMKIAMVRVRKSISEFEDRVQPILQIHDDLTFLVHESVSNQQVVSKVADAMVFPIKGYVDLKVDVKVGPSWGELSKYCQNCNEIITSEHACVDSTPKVTVPKVEIESEPEPDLLPVTLTLREGLTEKDLEAMKKLLVGEHPVVVEFAGSYLKLDESWKISAENALRWEREFGIATEETPQVKVDFA